MTERASLARSLSGSRPAPSRSSSDRPSSRPSLRPWSAVSSRSSSQRRRRSPAITPRSRSPGSACRRKAGEKDSPSSARSPSEPPPSPASQRWDTRPASGRCTLQRSLNRRWPRPPRQTDLAGLVAEHWPDRRRTARRRFRDRRASPLSCCHRAACNLRPGRARAAEHSIVAPPSGLTWSALVYARDFFSRRVGCNPCWPQPKSATSSPRGCCSSRASTRPLHGLIWPETG